MAEVLAVPDANVFLEFRDFPEVDWQALLQARKVVLLITIPVLRELDKAKRGRGRRRERAISVTRRVTSMTNQTGEARVREGVALRLLHLEIDRSKVLAPLSPDVPDDYIVAIVRDLAERSPTPAILVTDDTVLEAKARTLGLQVVSMPEDHRLPAEPSEESRELKRLRERVQTLESRLPEPALFLKNQEGGLVTHGSFMLATPREPTAQDYEARIGELQERYQQLAETLRAPKNLGFAALFHRRPTAEEIEQFEGAVRKYLASMRLYLPMLYGWERIAGRQLRLQVVVGNGGYAPAQDARVFLHFPDGVEVEPEARPKPTPPVEPSPPNTLSSIAAALIPLMSTRLELPFIPPRIPSNLGPNPNAPRIRKGSIEVSFGPQTIMHGFQWEPDPVWVAFPETSGPLDVTVHYKIHAANLPVRAEGAIMLTLEYQQVEPWTISGSREENEEEEG